MFEKREDSNNRFTSLIITFGFFVLYYSFFSEKDNNNILIYAIGCVLFIICYCVVNTFLDHLNIGSELYFNIITCICILFICYYYIMIYISEPNLFANNAHIDTIRQKLPLAIYFGILAIISYLLVKSIIALDKCSFNKRYYFCVVIALIQGAYIYSPNFGGISGYTAAYHIHAYVNSITNVLYHVPYNRYNISIYGHYGLIYFIPVKILSRFGISFYNAIDICIALITCIIFLLFYRLLNIIINNDVIFYLSVIASSVISTYIYAGQYYQVLPHRILFSIVTLYICYGMISKRKVNRYGYFICSLAIIWNLETGIVCLMSFLMTALIIDIFEKKYNSIVLDIMMSVLSVVGAYIIVSLYNIICGGTFNDINTFIYPIHSDVYQIDNLRTDLQTVYSGYIVEMSVFLAAICIFISQLVKKQYDKKIFFVAIVSVQALGVYVYYINRTAFCNISISHLQFIIVLAVFLEYSKKLLGSNKGMESYIVINCIIIPLLVAMSLTSISKFGITTEQKFALDWNDKDMQITIRRIEYNVPEDIIAFGICVPEIYAKMNRSTHLHTIDWSDMNSENEKYISKKIKKQKYVFAEQNALEKVRGKTEWETIKEFDIAGMKYCYYKKIK